MSHLTYTEAIITGLVQGVSELFPISSLGHNVLVPALIGGQWAKDLSVSAPGSPYLTFIIGLHVATALAMILYFWRDWLRIIRGFVTSIRYRQISDPDQRLAWMIILGTIPVGIAGLLLQKVVTDDLASPILAALFLAVNGVLLLYSERQRRQAEALEPAGDWEGDENWSADEQPVDDSPRGRRGGASPRDEYGPRGGGDPRGRGGDPRGADPRWTGGGPRRGGYDQGGHDVGPDEATRAWNQQPGQQQWQGPDPRYDDPRGGRRPGTPGGPSFNPSGNPAGPGGPGPGPRGGDPRAPGGEPRFSPGPQGGQGPAFRPSGPAGPGGPAGPAGPGRPGAPGPDPRGAGIRPPWEERPGRGQRGPQGPRGPRDPRQPGFDGDPRDRDPRGGDPRDPRGTGPRGGGFREAGPRGGGRRGGPRDLDPRDGQPAAEGGGSIAADRRLATVGLKKGLAIGAWQIAALMPGISRDGIVTIAGMRGHLRREDAVRFSFLLSAPVILAAGVLKLPSLFGPAGHGILGPVLVGSLLSFVGAYFSIRFLTKYFSEEKSLKPFGYYCLALGVIAFLFLAAKNFL
ncbi:MAG TPA: undecaprenyl-diphosphate phosphatase [Trebonia sp.]|jgi:undecaprenyl pyrophosphate phosphatase UppP